MMRGILEQRSSMPPRRPHPRPARRARGPLPRPRG